MRIEALTEKTLKGALNVVNAVFPVQIEEPAESAFRASLNPEKYKIFLAKAQIAELRYWVAQNDLGRVVGTAGLYCYEKDRDKAFWLGWFCIAPSARNQGIGTELLQFSIEKAKEQGKKFLRLWTTTDPNELDAHRLYEKHEFRLKKEEPFADTGLKKLYYELKL